ncbi:hypothetical protein PVAND_001897 [Polypedilum vanderplanki]|uniref:Uncharacterized protein n=1 Tax=Polypedilum vanderplanki TaxID=319348 RepID=A0A9J6BPU4_POLVA|nr:hypothetical protein PVAND_001897 [Polypedilum vanderplanki]
MKNYGIALALLCILSAQLVYSAPNTIDLSMNVEQKAPKVTTEAPIEISVSIMTSETPKKDEQVTQIPIVVGTEISVVKDQEQKSVDDSDNISTPDDTTTSTTSTTSVSPPNSDNTTTTSTTTSTTTTTTLAPVPDTTTTAPTTSTTPTPLPTTTKPTPAPDHDRSQFSVTAFIGGMVFAFGMMAIGFIAFKFYKARNERNYHTL